MEFSMQIIQFFNIVPGGVYICELETPKTKQTKRLVVEK